MPTNLNRIMTSSISNNTEEQKRK